MLQCVAVCCSERDSIAWRALAKDIPESLSGRGKESEREREYIVLRKLATAIPKSLYESL